MGLPLLPLLSLSPSGGASTSPPLPFVPSGSGLSLPKLQVALWRPAHLAFPLFLTLGSSFPSTTCFPDRLLTSAGVKVTHQIPVLSELASWWGETHRARR